MLLPARIARMLNAYLHICHSVTPSANRSMGLKVDADALPQQLVEQIKAGQVDLDDPTTTLALLKLNAAVGVTGCFDGQGRLTSMGIQCASCHSAVDDSFALGNGHRLDGWPNRDPNVGAIVSLAPNLQLQGWEFCVGVKDDGEGPWFED